jgi:hypothetical protein
MTTKVIRAGFVSDANTYINGIVQVNCESVKDAIMHVIKFVDELKKGWHVENITMDDELNTITVTVYKRD